MKKQYRRIFKSSLTLLLGIAQFCPPAFAAEMPAWCGRYLLDRTAESHLEINEELGLLPLPLKVAAYSQGTSANPALIDKRDRTTFDLPGDREKLDLVNAQSEKKIQTAAVRNAVESFYTIYDPAAADVSRLGLRPEQIANAAAALICNAGCGSELRESLRTEAKSAVAKMQADDVRRKSLAEAADSLKTSIAGLNSLLADRSTDAQTAYWSYRHYYLDLLATPEGAILSLESMAPVIGKAFSMDDFEKSHGQLRHGDGFTPQQLGRAFKENYMRQQHAWGERALWLEKMASEIPDDDLKYRQSSQPLRKLSFYLNTAPLAVVEVFHEHKELIPDLCWMLRATDSLNYDIEWKASVSNFAWYIAPINIGIVAGIFLVGTGGVTVVPLALAALALKGLTAYEIYHSYEHTQGLQAEARIAKLNVASGLGSVQGLKDLDEVHEKIHKGHDEIALVLALEMASFGIAEAVATRAEKAFIASSADQKLRWLNLLFKSRNGTSQLYRMHIHNPKDLAQWYRTATPEEVEKLMFKYKGFGFGKTLVLNEAGIDVVQEGMKMAKTSMFEEINPFSALVSALQAN